MAAGQGGTAGQAGSSTGRLLQPHGAAGAHRSVPFPPLLRRSQSGSTLPSGPAGRQRRLYPGQAEAGPAARTEHVPPQLGGLGFAGQC